LMKLKTFLKKRGPHTLAGASGASNFPYWGLRAFISHAANGRHVTQVTPGEEGFLDPGRIDDR
ncbi:MAG: hypothetical protein WA859_12555, partial [Candidatus Sulfotelmatobacter sp.]